VNEIFQSDQIELHMDCSSPYDPSEITLILSKKSEHVQENGVSWFRYEYDEGQHDANLSRQELRTKIQQRLREITRDNHLLVNMGVNTLEIMTDLAKHKNKDILDCHPLT